MDSINYDSIIIYDNVTLGQVLKEIHQNSFTKAEDIKGLIENLSRLAQERPNLAPTLMDSITQLLEVAVKNDDQLIKLANIVTKGTATKSDSGNSSLITDEEKADLLSAHLELRQINATIKELPMKNV